MPEDASELDPTDRTHLEVALSRLASSGHIPPIGEREIVIRLGDDGRIRWHEARRIRVPASELDRT